MKLNILSFDIEVLPLGDKMPIPDKCPVVMISLVGNYDLVGTGREKKKKIVMILDREGKYRVEDKGNYLLARFGDEKAMIGKLGELVQESDIVVGYNICGFDFPYIVDRCRALGIGRELKLGMADDVLWCRSRISKGMKVVTVGGMKGKIIFDVLYMLRRADESNVMKKEYNLKNLTLAHVSREILGEDSGKLKFSASDIVRWWGSGERENDFIEYGLRDSEVVLEMVQKFRLLDRFFMLSRKSGKLIQDVLDSTGFGGLVENLLMKAYRIEDRVMPCRSRGSSGFGFESGGRDSDSESESGLVGAYVHEPKLGITDHISSVDYKSLYSSLMIKHNLCYSTVVMDGTGDVDVEYEEITSEDGILYGKFVKKEAYVGIIPRILKDLMIERSELKGEMKKYEKGSVEYIAYDAGQNAVKILLNSFYGYTGDEDSKIYSWNVSNSVTGMGRKQIVGTINQINSSVIVRDGRSYNMNVALADTDSSYIRVIGSVGELINRDIVVGVVGEIIEKVNEKLEKPMELVYENYIRRLLVSAKKHYVMLVEDDKGRTSIVSKGIESVRRDWCDYSSENMETVVEILLNEEDVGKGINESIKFIQGEADRLRKGKVDIEKLVLSKKLSKMITGDYKAVHVSVAKKMVSRGKKVEVGDRISYFIMNNGKKLISEKAEDVDWVVNEGLTDKIDVEYYINHQLLPPVGRMLEVLGVKVGSINVDSGQKLLMDF